MTGGSSSLSAPRITTQKPIPEEDEETQLPQKQVLKKKKKSKIS